MTGYNGSLKTKRVFVIQASNHTSRIPPSLTITRYLHDFAKLNALSLIGPLYQGNAHFEDPVIFVDGGAQFRKVSEGLSVGDGDSHSEAMDEKLNPNKNYSDLAYVLSSLPAHFHEVCLYGFIGGRRDHEWANVGEVHAFLQTRYQPTKLHFESEVTGFSAGKWQLEINAPFSLLCMEVAKVKLTGDCRYPLKQATKIEPLSSHGLSNIGKGSITLETNKPVFVLYPDNHL